MLNKRYLDPQTETAVLDEPVGPDDFDKDNYDVCPTADPSATSKQEKLAKAQTLMEIGGQLGTLDKIKVTERVLDALEESKDLISQQGPPPDPKVEALKMKAQIDQAKAQQDMQKSQMEEALAQRESETKLKMEAAMNQQEMMHKFDMAKMEMQASKMKMMMESMKGASEMAHKDMDHKQKMVKSEEQHKQKMKHQPKEGKPK